MPKASPHAERLTRLRFPFRRKVSVAGLLLSALPLLGASLALLNINASTVELQARELQLAVIDDLARTVAETSDEAQASLLALANILGDTGLSELEAERLSVAVLGASGSLDHAAVYDGTGRAVDRMSKAGANAPEPPLALPRRCQTEAAERGICLEAAAPAPGGPRLGMAVPLRVGDSVRGYVYSRVPLSGLQRRIERLVELRFSGQPESLFVVDERLRLLAHPDRERVEAFDLVDAQGFLAHLDPRVLAHPLNLSGEYEQRGQGMVGTLVSLPELRWAVVAQLPRSVVYASMTRMRNAIAVTVVVLLILVALASLIVGRWVSRPVSELMAFAGQLSKRKFDQRIHIASGDEFEVLSEAMSDSAAELLASEERTRRELEIRADLGRYLPTELVDRVIERRQAMDLGGTRREVTVLFADVVAFTPLTERLSPETTVSLLNELFTVLTEIVFRNGGTIDKFIGDCVMALWGAAEVVDADEADTTRALEAAGEMMSWLETINESWLERYGAEIRLAIGVHVGEAVVGNIGSRTRMEYTVIGDTVNLAAQLESIARPSQILVTEAVKEAAGTGFAYVDLGDRELPGREHRVHLYEVRT